MFLVIKYRYDFSLKYGGKIKINLLS